MGKIITREEYGNHFRGNSKKAKALEYCYKRLDEEINLYWSRSNYFLMIMLLLPAAYYSVWMSYFPEATKDTLFPKVLKVVLLSISLLGVLLSYIWLLTLKSCKIWQKNWEKHIERLEDGVIGPLLKMTYHERDKAKWWKISRRRSLTGLNEYVARASFWISILTTAYLFIFIFLGKDIVEVASLEAISSSLLALTVFCVIAICRKKSKIEGWLDNEIRKKKNGSEDANSKEPVKEEQYFYMRGKNQSK
jgi:hypothetical protein